MTMKGDLITLHKGIIIEFFKFGFIGLIGTILNLLILYLLTEHLKIYYLISATLAFIITVTANFVGNKTWTFKEKISTQVVEKYRCYFTVSLLSLTVSLFFLYFFTEFLGICYLISQVLAIGISFSINFVGNKLWSFRKL